MMCKRFSKIINFVHFNAKLNRTLLVHSHKLSNAVAIKTYDDIPGPKPRLIIGNILETKACGGDLDLLSFRDFLLQLQTKYGDIVRWSNPEFNPKKWHEINRNVFLFDPEHIRQVFKADGSTPARPELEPLNKLHAKIGIKSGLVNSQGERWRQLRTTSNPIIAKIQTIQSYLNNHNQVANEFIRLIDKNARENSNNIAVYERFEENLRLLTLEYVSEITFNKRLHCMDETTRLPDVTKFVQAVDDFSVYAGRLVFQPPIWKIYPTKDWIAFENAGIFIYKVCRKYIEEAYKELLSTDDIKKTILGQYLERKHLYNLSINDVISVMSEFLIGGVDTTAVSLYYLLYEIGTKKDVQQDLYNEINSILKPDEQITPELLDRFKYLKNVVKEAARLHVVAPTNSRILQEDLILENYKIPKLTHVIFSNAVITRSEKYFKNPSDFNPRRWEDSSEKIHPFASLPFGHGIRTCLGQRIANQEIYVTLIKILQNFEVKYLGEKVGFKIALIASPDVPLKISFIKRNV